MAATFSRTLRSIQADGSHRHTGKLLIAAALLSGWGMWFVLGQVALYEVTNGAYLEVEAAAHPLAAQVSGRVVRTDLELGKEVKAGEVLVELDAEAERFALEEARARLTGLQAQFQALRLQLQAEETALEAHRRTSTVTLEEARSRVAEAEAHARFAEHQVKALGALRGKAMVSDEQFRQTQAEAEARVAAVQALRLAAARLEREQALQQSDRQVRIAELKRESAELTGAANTQEAAIGRLEREVEHRLLRAPLAGRVEQTWALRVGSVVETADILGAIVPPGKPRAVAFFPVAGVGRIRPGQPARLRLAGFPWTQYGVLKAKVAAVGNEPTNGQVRVELAVLAESAPTIPLQHGLAATAEVEVEHTTPALLVLRNVGKLLTSPGRSATTVGEWTAR